MKLLFNFGLLFHLVLSVNTLYALDFKAFERLCPPNAQPTGCQEAGIKCQLPSQQNQVARNNTRGRSCQLNGSIPLANIDSRCAKRVGLKAAALCEHNRKVLCTAMLTESCCASQCVYMIQEGFGRQDCFNACQAAYF
ncbi:MAG: hypothetical protein R3B45_10090 [Bdellovibrionota bacterium]